MAAAAASPSGLIRHKTLEEVDVYDAFAKSALTGWTIAVAAPVESIEASATKAAAPLALGLLVALIAGTISVTLLGRRMLTDVEAAMAAAGALGRGEQPIPPASSSFSELGALHNSLHDAGRLLADERQARAAVESERARLLAGEQAAREIAQEQNKAKDKFLAMLGHELRNPLAAITNAGAVLSQLNLPERGRRFVDLSRRQTRHLARIVDDLLDSSRMLSGKLTLRTAPLDLGASAKACVDAMQGSAHEGQTPQLLLRADEVWIDGDPVRIEQILSNLITNAIKYSPPGSPIRVSVLAEGNQAVLRVEDEGQGIEPHVVPRIFEPFFQGATVPGTAGSGLGIGLALVKQLVELHGGTVEAVPNPRGRGSVFSVRLPRTVHPRGATSTEADAGQHSCAVLLVEDNADARQATAEVLRMLGYRVSEAEDGEAALASMAASKPEVVLMDIGLPGRSGHEIAQEVRRTPDLAGVALVALSGYGRDSDKARSLQSGFDAHLAKPATPEDLSRTITRHCSQKRLEGAERRS